MNGIVERLRNDQGIGINLTLCREAAAEIERLRAALKEAAAKRTDCEKSSNELFLRREEAQSELNAAADEIERLRAQVAALREALEFYADRNFDGYQVDVTDYGLYGLSTDCGHIIEDAGTIARVALEEK